MSFAWLDNRFSFACQLLCVAIELKAKPMLIAVHNTAELPPVGTSKGCSFTAKTKRQWREIEQPGLKAEPKAQVRAKPKTRVGGRGRPRVDEKPMEKQSILYPMLWGIDLGGTKIEGAILRDSNDTNPTCRVRIDTEASHGYNHVVERIALLVDKMRQESGQEPTALGIGTPGTVDPKTGLMKNCNTVCLNGQPLLGDIKERLQLPVKIANDANCFALAEATMGAAKGYETVFGVIMGTGVGGGLVVNGHVLNGAQGIAGEWGHNLLDPQGVKCYCGKIGCVETCICGPATERYYQSLSGHHLKLKEIAARHRSGNDEHATATIRNLCERFGEAISVVIDIFDPHAVVLGGGVGNIPELQTWGVEACEKRVFNNRLDTAFLAPTLGDSAGVFGAAMLFA
jgi:predicted NBD/HSP70 family sugar kinase